MRGALLATLLATTCAPPVSAQLQRGPYLVAASSTSAQICWRFKGADGCHLFEGLAPGATFSYSFAGVSTQTWTAETLPASSGTLWFALLGNVGGDPGAQERLASVLAKSRAQLVVVLGDIASGDDRRYDAAYFRPFAALLSRLPFLAAAGDEDYGGASTAKRGRRRFDDVYARVQRKPPYYSFDAGPAHFAVLDSNDAFYIPAAAPINPGSEQRRWLDDDLARSQAPWKFVVTHVPLYSTMRYHGENGLLRQAIEDILRRRGVDAVFQAHDRIYERSRAIGGVVYVTAGTGGEPLNARQELEPEWLEKRVAAFGAVVARLDPRELLLDFVDDQGVVRDSLVLKKGG